MNNDGTFENVGEIYKALLEGKTICYMLRGEPYVKLVDGRWDSSNGDIYNFDNPKHWVISEAPKPKQKFYRRKWILFDFGTVVPYLKTDNPYYPSIEEFDDLCAHAKINKVSEEIEEVEI